MTRAWATVRLMLLARMVQNPDVLQPYVRRAQIRPRGAYREPDLGRARSQSPLRIEPKIQVPANGPRRARATPTRTVRASENRKGNARHQPLSPVQRRTRGDERNSRSGTACRELANATHKHATRPANAEGKPASTSGVPATHPHRDPLGIACGKRTQGRPCRCDCRRSRQIVAHTNTNPRNRASPREARVLMLRTGSEICG
jgi:hypothetical protein